MLKEAVLQLFARRHMPSKGAGCCRHVGGQSMCRGDHLGMSRSASSPSQEKDERHPVQMGAKMRDEIGGENAGTCHLWRVQHAFL